MYVLNKAYVLNDSNFKGYEEVDISQMRLLDLFNNYQHIYVTVYNTYNPNKMMGYDLNRNKDRTAPLLLTLDEWFASIGNAVLPTDDTPLELKNNYVKYKDAFVAGYTLEPQFEDAHPDHPYSRGAKTALLISKEGLDHVDVLDHTLFSINGYYHYSEHTPYGLLIRNAIKTLKHSGKNQVGVTSFKGVGKVVQRRLKETDLENDSNGNGLNKKILIKLQPEDKGKTLGFVLLGRLFLGEPYVTYFNEDYVIIDTTQFDIKALYMYAIKSLDLSVLDVKAFESTLDSLDVGSLLSDEGIRAIFQLPQSFLVTVDVPKLYKEYKLLDQSELPDRYFNKDKIDTPITGPLGLITEYVQYEDWGHYVICTDEVYDQQSLFLTTQKIDLAVSNVIETKERFNKYPISQLFLYSSHI